jgi:hypothetical protein
MIKVIITSLKKQDFPLKNQKPKILGKIQKRSRNSKEL